MSIFLYLLSLIYGTFVRLKVFCCNAGISRRHKLDCKVISVGNITVGGTGKTTFVEFLARYLQIQGRKVAILSRGSASYLLYNKPCMDEPTMLRENLPDVPVIIGVDRVKNAKIAMHNYQAEVLILDDGFQYRRMHRDLDIAMIDSTNPFGNESLLPKGILREHISSLKMAQIFCLTKVDLAYQVEGLKVRLSQINPDAIIVESIHKISGLYDPINKESLNLNILKGMKVLLISAIADPASFEKMVRKTQAVVIRHIAFTDHYQYKSEDLNLIYSIYKKTNAEAIVTTQKDWVKLCGMRIAECGLQNDAKIFVLKIELELVSNEENLFRRLDRILCS